MLRSSFVAVLMLGLSACKPDLPHTDPTPVVNAVFDPTTNSVPLPNDLALLTAPNSACPGMPAGTAPACAQAELLASFNGSFPSDQEVPVTIDFVKTSFDADGVPVTSAPDLDVTSFTPATFSFVSTPVGSTTAVAVDYEPLTAADYVKAADGSKGTLTIHNKSHNPWSQGAYTLVVRGGDSGVKTTDGLAVGPSQVFALIEQGLDMTDPKNLGLLRAQFGTNAAAAAQGQQLNVVISIYKATNSAFPVADAIFPHQELAIATTFKVGAPFTNVTIDPARGLVPLPIDLLRDPASGKLSELAACTFASSSLGPDGKSCATASATAAAAGFAALDGFSTTGAILGPTSDLILAKTVTKDSLMLFDLSDPANPALVDPTSLIIEPCEFTESCNLMTTPNPRSPVIAFQPAGATAGDPTSVFRTKPLKDNTDYAVVMTNAILDKANQPLQSGTTAKILRFTNPITVDGKSALSGIDDVTAASLEKMRLQLQPVLAKLDASKVAMAYTFHTQTILSQAIQLAALPYTTPAATALPGPVPATGAATDPASVIAKYGATGGKSTNINEILETTITTFNALDPATGAFLADPTMAAPETIKVMIATPKATNANVPACTGGLAAFGKCAPLMVFHHGLGRGRADMLELADAFAAAGMVTVAIDAAKHGDRTLCTSGGTGNAAGCNTGVACNTALPAGAQGDANPPGACADGMLFKKGVAGQALSATVTDGIPALSSNYLVSANFFRTRDSMRQDLIDQAQLIRALAFVPSGAPPTGNNVFDHMVAQGLIIDPQAIYFTGQSLGSIQGTMDVATNPRISKAVFNVGGGTIVDIFTNAPAFASVVNPLLASLGINKVTNPSGYLQFLTVAKTVLDPADPINFAGHLTANTLPNLLTPLGGNSNGSVPQTAKKILTQIAYCDNTVPNPFNLIHSSNIGVGPTPAVGAAFFGGGTGTFQLFVNTGFTANEFGQDCAGAGLVGTVSHGFLLDFIVPTLTGKAQTDAAKFLTAATDATAQQPSVETP
jgi:hypothetical protein